ncbi:FliI/YscN family ATPase [Alphaproteobacteria bacterium]|jgi:flagellum-specific ATP synthase|nr:FliI/YscN family ATPase [Alphaproteobacteria bacterium]
MSLLSSRLSEAVSTHAQHDHVRMSGRVSRFDGHMIECGGFPATIGTLCRIETEGGNSAIAEIIGFQNSNNLLCVHETGARISVGAQVTVEDDGYEIPVGEGLLGRVFDALGMPLDGRGPAQLEDSWPLEGVQINPLARRSVDTPLDVGVRVINSLLTVGQGQRLGIIAGSGVGKSVLLGMMTRFTKADVVVVGLIGERGREVGDFVRTVFNAESRGRTVIVAEPADRSPLLRIRAAKRATAIAEYFRDQGKNVLLIMDSLTRVAHARREIGLALGEQPTSKGYPPSVVSLIPALVERSGTGLNGQGSITSFYTVLADGDDTNDPVVDTARAILDGHILLSRQQAQMGIYPAVDVPASVSRVMTEIVSPEHIAAGQMFRRLMSLYMENRDLLLMGGYSAGQDPDLDLAVQLWPQLISLIQQPQTDLADFESSAAALTGLFGTSQKGGL